VRSARSLRPAQARRCGKSPLQISPCSAKPTEPGVPDRERSGRRRLPPGEARHGACRLALISHRAVPSCRVRNVALADRPLKEIERPGIPWPGALPGLRSQPRQGGEAMRVETGGDRMAIYPHLDPPNRTVQRFTANHLAVSPNFTCRSAPSRASAAGLATGQRASKSALLPVTHPQSVHRHEVTRSGRAPRSAPGRCACHVVASNQSPPVDDADVGAAVLRAAMLRGTMRL